MPVYAALAIERWLDGEGGWSPLTYVSHRYQQCNDNASEVARRDLVALQFRPRRRGCKVAR
jgi:hypothetical protein